MNAELKTYIVPVVHRVEFGCEVRVQARNKREAAKLAKDHKAEVIGEGYDWSRYELTQVRQGYWQEIEEED